MGAVRETAFLGKMEYLLKIRGELCLLNVESAETTNARGVDNPAIAAFKRYHLRESGGVDALVVGITYLCRTQIGMRNDSIDER